MCMVSVYSCSKSIRIAIHRACRYIRTPTCACFCFASISQVIGQAGDVELIAPVNPTESAMMQWKAPDVFSGSSSPLHYNITVRDSSMQVIAKGTTMGTTYPINTDLLVPCDSYLLTVLPFQQNSGHTELGITTQTVTNYSGSKLLFVIECNTYVLNFFPAILPATDVKYSVSVDGEAANVTIDFQVVIYTW